ncbi:CapA family protein [Leifsonia sp. NPDC058230]|uniref:CapA family protein n=1 Tax=Leifsonia sp. NPDC058230 TaxID=3346391 RepID=UPI0036D8AADA
MTDPSSTHATREGWGDALKGVLILLVVLWHVIMKSYLQVDWHISVPIPGAWGLFGDLIWPFMMPLFLLVSGYFAANALTRPWSAVARPRILRFLYLYLLWSLIHMALLWAFPDFPTLIPRSLAEFVEFVTISPPNTWYLYALALYFLVAKALSRFRPWLIISAAAVLSIVVSAGYVDVVSNRASLLYNFTFFLLGLHLAPQIRRFANRVTLPVAGVLIAGYLVVFGAMRLTGTETLPGVWPLVSVVGVATGLAAARTISRMWRVGAGLAWLGRRSLPIYLIHMPLLAICDLVLVQWLSDARVGVQLVAAVMLPVVLSALLVAVSLLLDRLLARDGASWLFDLPRRPVPSRTRRSVASGAVLRRAPWRAGVAVMLLAASGIVAARAIAIPGCAPDFRSQPADLPGQVSIGATGDLLIHDIGHGVPDDGGADHFEAVRPWFTQDVVTGNLEQAITEDTGYDKCGADTDCLAFRSDPETAQYFAGFDLLNLANNHTNDFGAAGYANTRSNLAANDIRTVGDRNEIVCTRIGDTTVAVIGFAPYQGTNRVTDLRHVRNLVRAAAASADLVVVHSHMGAEGPDANVVTSGVERMYGENRGDVMAFSHAAVDAGADLVIGHGPHSLRGTEFYKGRLIAYSLGNFGGGGVFGAEQSTRYGAYLDVSLRSDGGFVRGALRSVIFDYQDGRPRPDPDSRAARLMDEFSQRDFPDTAPQIDAAGVLTPTRRSG